jgi:hypothetical protein
MPLQFRGNTSEYVNIFLHICTRNDPSTHLSSTTVSNCSSHCNATLTYKQQPECGKPDQSPQEFTKPEVKTLDQVDAWTAAFVNPGTRDQW